MSDNAQSGGALHWRTVLSGSQMLFVAFGALVLMPLLTGIDPNVALFTAGVGTLLFHLVTGLRVPIFLASSFVFIAPITYSVQNWGMAATMGGLIVITSYSIHYTKLYDRMRPPVRTRRSRVGASCTSGPAKMLATSVSAWTVGASCGRLARRR